MGTGQKRIIASTKLSKNPGGGPETVFQLNEYCIVTPTGKQNLAGTPSVLWTEIQYVDQFKGGPFTGWVYDGYLEDYPNPGNVVHIDQSVRVSYSTLGVQDIVYSKIKQFNLCGEFTVAHIGGDGIVDFLDKWSKSGKSANAILSKGSTTGIPHLQEMLAIYGYQDNCLGFLEGLKDPILGKSHYVASVGRMSRMLKDYWLIAGVNIDNRTGEFVRSAGGSNHVGHWVVVESIKPYGRNNGTVHLYNPFPNNFQDITFRLLMQSIGGGDVTRLGDLSGLWVPKTPSIPNGGAPI